jgi:tRNA pseudouridine32 synthase/23S rRNA pseudouridine746 synthase
MLYHPSPSIQLTLQASFPALTEPTHSKTPLKTLHKEGFDIPIVQADGHFLCVSKPPFLRIDAKKEDEKACTLERIVGEQLIAKENASKDSRAEDPLHDIGELKQTHQLDANTSGVFLYAKHRLAAGEAGRQFEERKAKKTYLAILHGHVDIQRLVNHMVGKTSLSTDSLEGRPNTETSQSLRIDAWIQQISQQRCEVVVAPPLDSVNAETKTLAGKGHPQASATVLTPLCHIHVFSARIPATLVRLDPITGRRHQLRVHCAAIGHAIVGDWEYERERTEEGGRLYLHAFQLEMKFPDAGMLNGTSRRGKRGKLMSDGREVGVRYTWRSETPFQDVLDVGSLERLDRML